MTLKVEVYKYNIDTQQKEFLTSELGKNLVGAEESRKDFWSNEIMNTLGLIILPSLLNQNIDVSGTKLEELQREIEIILQNIGTVLEATKYHELTIMRSTENINNAIYMAKQINGGVIIW